MPVRVLKARQIYDCSGVPTIEVEVRNEKDTALASVPAGVSVSTREAVELRDNEMRQWHGKGVLKAVENVNKIIAPLFIGKEVDETNQALVDRLMVEADRTPDKSRLGANAIAAVSMAMARLGAMKEGIPLYKHIGRLAGNDKNVQEYLLPVPVVPIMGGGVHTDSNLFIDEVMLMPTDFSSFTSAMKAVSEIYQQLKFLISKNYGLQYTNVGMSGLLSPPVKNEVEALELVKKAIERAMCTGFVKVALNGRAANFHKNGSYDLDFRSDNPSPLRTLDSASLAELYKGLLIDYSIISLEDPFHNEDFPAWVSFTAKTSIQVAGNQFLCTNPAILQKAASKRACNCLVLSLSQIGTVSESIEVFKAAKEAGWSCIVSDRAIDTEDHFIADLAVGLGAGQIKSGAPCRYERVSKYNQLLRIEEALGPIGTYAGHKFRRIHRT